MEVTVIKKLNGLIMHKVDDSIEVRGDYSKVVPELDIDASCSIDLTPYIPDNVMQQLLTLYDQAQATIDQHG